VNALMFVALIGSIALFICGIVIGWIASSWWHER